MFSPGTALTLRGGFQTCSDWCDGMCIRYRSLLHHQRRCSLEAARAKAMFEKSSKQGKGVGGASAGGGSAKSSWSTVASVGAAKKSVAVAKKAGKGNSFAAFGDMDD